MFSQTWDATKTLLLMCRRIKLQPDLDELIKQLGGPAPPPLPRGQVLDSNKNIASTSLLGASSIACGIRHVGTKRRLNRLCVRGKHLLQVICLVVVITWRLSSPGRLLSLWMWWWLKPDDLASSSMVSQIGFMKRRWSAQSFFLFYNLEWYCDNLLFVFFCVFSDDNF